MKKAKWYKQPTTWGGLAALAAIGGAWASGEISQNQAITGAILSILGAIFPENKTIRKD